MTLAAIDGYLIWIAAAAYGVVAWFNERKQKKALAEEEARKRAEGGGNTPSRPSGASETSEEERMRKFLEALGVPSGPQSPPLRPSPAPAPLKPAPTIAPKPTLPKPASPTLAPRPVAMPIPRPMVTRPAQVPARMAPPPRPKPPIPEPASYESMDPGRLEEPASRVEQVSTDFARMHEQRMAVDTLPSIRIAAAGAAGTTSVDPRLVSAQGLALREMLRSPESIRAAVVVSEVLGPPKGL
jgi:hypothetical protein